MSEKAKGVMGLPFFRRFSEDEVDEVLELAVIQSFEEGTYIFKEGEAGDGMYVILSGSVDVQKNIAGKSVSLATLGSGDILGESAALQFETKKRNASAFCACKSAALAVTKDILDAIFRKNPAIGCKFYRVLGLISATRLTRVDEMYTQLFIETKGAAKLSDLKSMREQLNKEWGI